MDDLGSLIELAIKGVPESLHVDDPTERRAWIGAVFRVYGEQDGQRAVLYLRETQEIPLGILRHACRLVLRSRVYSSLPTIGELWNAARQVAGMHRQQYSAGRYVGAPRDWPPEGKRYAVTAGDLEPLAACTALVTAGAREPFAQIEGGTTE